MSRLKWGLLGLAAVPFSCFLFLPCIKKGWDSGGRYGSMASLRSIAVAIHQYRENYGTLPPAVVRDKDGRPLYSWRVLLLPILERERPDEQVLSREFRLEEPWDSPHNRQLLRRTPRCYLPMSGPGAGSHEPGTTNYQVLVGPRTAFERDGLTLNDFPDGLGNTMLVVEGSEAVPWTKPADLAYDPAGPLPVLGGLFEEPVRFLCREVGGRPGFSAAFGDGSTRFIRRDTDEKTIRGLITRNGGEQVD